MDNPSPSGFPNPGSAQPSGQPNQESRVAPPPPEEITLRTLASDKSSVERGESVPIPESVLPPETSSEPVFTPQTSDQTPDGVQPPHRSRKTLVLVVMGAIVISGLGAAGFFLFPVLFPAEPNTPAETPPISPPPPVLVHHSFFTSPPASTIDLVLRSTQVQSVTITELLKQLSENPLPPDTIQEIVVKDQLGNQIAWPVFFSTMNSTFTADELAGWFEENFTAFLYYDSNGVWPGYAARVKEGIDLSALKANLARFETSNISRLFLRSPGAFQPFKDGVLSTHPSRYALGSEVGAALNYLLTENRYFVISTSYDGLKAVSLLLSF